MKWLVYAAMAIAGSAFITVGFCCEGTEYSNWCWLCGFAGGGLASQAVLWTVLSAFGADRLYFN